MRKKKGGEQLLNALLATTWDKENHCVIKTVSPTDSFVLIGSSEQVVKKTGPEGCLTSIIVKIPNQGERGLVGIVLRRELGDVLYGCCDAQMIKQTVLFILLTSERSGKPRAQISETWIAPLAKVKFSIDNEFFVELVTPHHGKFTTNSRKAYESRKEHIWYVPSRKMFCFLIRPSCEFLLEAAKCAYFERLALRRDDLLQNLMEDIFEHGDELEKRDIHLCQLQQDLDTTRSSVENYKRRVDFVEEELFALENELNDMCREEDARMLLEAEEEYNDYARLRKKIRELEFCLEDSGYFKADMERLVFCLRKLLSKKGKGVLYESLVEVAEDFPGLFKTG